MSDVPCISQIKAMLDLAYNARQMAWPQAAEKWEINAFNAMKKRMAVSFADRPHTPYPVEKP